jgi:hypothetical protein
MRKLTTRLGLGLLLMLPVLLAGTASAESTSTPPRVRPLVTVESSEYTAELVVVASDGAHNAYFRRTDDVGSMPSDQPDAHGFVQASGWDISGRRCLGSGGGEFTFPDAGPHAFTYGIAGRAIRRVVIVMDDGTRVRVAVRSRRVAGLRGWMVERPLGQVDHIEGLDALGRVVSTITVVGGPDDFGYSIDTCLRPQE